MRSPTVPLVRPCAFSSVSSRAPISAPVRGPSCGPRPGLMPVVVVGMQRRGVEGLAVLEAPRCRRRARRSCAVARQRDLAVQRGADLVVVDRRGLARIVVAQAFFLGAPRDGGDQQGLIGRSCASWPSASAWCRAGSRAGRRPAPCRAASVRCCRRARRRRLRAATDRRRRRPRSRSCAWCRGNPARSDRRRSAG